MRYKDLLEGAKIRQGVINPLPKTFVMKGLQSNDSYLQYRHMVALASARSMAAGEEHMDKESAWGENQAVVCYTDADEETLRMANAILGVDASAIVSTRSQESPQVNTVSPVRKFVDLDEGKVMRDIINKLDGGDLEATGSN